MVIFICEKQYFFNYCRWKLYDILYPRSHHVTMKNRTTGKTVIVPYHSKAMKKGLEQAIHKQAGLKKAVFGYLFLIFPSVLLRE